MRCPDRFRLVLLWTCAALALPAPALAADARPTLFPAGDAP